jgi:antitoxin CptB
MYSGSTPVDDRSLARRRWRCRRGMLENDLILARFLDARGDAMTRDEEAALDRLLDLTDNELWDLLSGRTEPVDASLRPLLIALRAA